MHKPSENLSAGLFSKTRMLFLGTLLSRISGMVRDLSMAAFFGASPFLGAFMTAFRFSNLLRRLLGEGALNNAFIPTYKEIEKNDPKSAKEYFGVFKGLFFLFLLFLVSGLELGAWVFRPYVGHEYEQIYDYTMILFPALLFLGQYALNSAYLACQHRFFVSGVAPFFFNVIWIAGAFYLKGKTSIEAMYALSWIVLLANAAQGFFTEYFVPSYFSFSQFLKQVKDFLSVHKVFLKRLSLVVVGVGASQINSALDPLFARYAALEAPCYLWYAIRVQQLPLALVGIALATVSFPMLSEASQENKEKAQEVLRLTLTKNILFLLPLSFFLPAVGYSGLNLLYGRGLFSPADVHETYVYLIAYGLGLFFSGINLCLVNLFFAHANYKVPSRISLLGVLLNLILNTLGVFYLNWGGMSVALATSLSAIFQSAILGYKIRKTLNYTHFFPFKLFIKLSLGFSLLLFVQAVALHVMGNSGLLSVVVEPYLLPRGVLGQLLAFSKDFLMWVGLIILGSYSLRIPEMRTFFSLLPGIKKT